MNAEYCLVDMDLHKLECRILQLDSHVVDYRKPAVDPHAVKAAELYGIPISDVTPEQRRVAKHENTRLAYSGTGRRPTEPEQQDMPR